MRFSAVQRVFSLLCLLAVAGLSPAQTIDNDTITITDFFDSFPGYDVEYAIDTGDDRFISDYASRGGGIDTFIEFDFGQSYTFSEIVMTDRVTSGGPNFVWFGGLFDHNTFYNYIFSTDPNFTNGNGTTDDILVEVEVEIPELSPVPEEEIAMLQTTTTIPNISARYLRWEVVETNGRNPGANDFEFKGRSSVVNGDFNGDGDLSAADIDALTTEVKAGTNMPRFDVTGDGRVDAADRTQWVNVLAKTYFGDSNLDGEFNSADFVVVFTAGEYEDAVAGNSTWAEGDWNGNMEFESGDFVEAFTAGGYEKGPRPAAAAVPEPAACTLALIGLGAMLLRRGR
jgi:hypothetical protein